MPRRTNTGMPAWTDHNPAVRFTEDSAMRANWMVQATVNEAFPLLAAFVSHYLELGADLVHLYLDSPHPDAEAAFKGHPKVKLTLCDAAYWASASDRGRPQGQTRRQKINSRATFAQLQQQWLLLCDADEYLVPDEDLGDILARQPANLDFLRVKVAEKVLPPDLVPTTVFEGSFRLPHTRGVKLAEQIYGPHLAQMLERVVAGHDIGKSIVRRGADVDVDIHRPKSHDAGTDAAGPPHVPVGAWISGVHLAHFDALTPLHYLIKLGNRPVPVAEPDGEGQRTKRIDRARLAQIAYVNKACALSDPIKATSLLHRLTPQSVAALQDFGLLINLPLAPDQAVRRQFPDLNLDFSPEAFDAALRIKHAETLKRLGLA